MKTKRRKTTLVDSIKETLFLSHARGEGPLNEDLLADRFGVSRTPVREALKALEEEGIIIRRQKRGIVLRPFSRREVAELFDVRGVLEVFAFRLACRRTAGKDLAVLRDIARRYRAAVEGGDMAEADHFDLQFHSQLITIAGNRYLIRLVKTLHLLSQAFQASTQWVDRPRRDRQFTHEEILEALAGNRPARGAAMLRRHVEIGKRHLLEKFPR
jgi:DNA-binding GntR family transcriptional regulator